jgi:hypothetical protein
VTPVSFEAQDDRSAWSAQIVIQLGDRPNMLTANANATSCFISPRRHFIGGDYIEPSKIGTQNSPRIITDATDQRG